MQQSMDRESFEYAEEYDVSSDMLPIPTVSFDAPQAEPYDTGYVIRTEVPFFDVPAINPMPDIPALTNYPLPYEPVQTAGGNSWLWLALAAGAVLLLSKKK